MRLRSIKGLTAITLAAGFLSLHTAGLAPTFGDEPNLFSRIFRTGGSSSSSSSSTNPTTPTPPSSTSGSSSATTGIPLSGYSGQPALSTPPSTVSGSAVTPMVKPKPRVNKPVTEADPLVTRVSLGRSDTGSQFGMFMEVFADGTVIDGEGVHHVSAEALKPVVEAVASGELAKLKGHCGGPAGDFIENVHVIVFDRSLGRLRASSFSFSGNPQGCDHAVHHLQKVLDELQTKLSPTAPGNPSPGVTNAPAPAQGLSTPPLPLTSP
jgi:hypothetical protein